jgi:hyperosmotically inducible periplasmic protein
MLKKVLISACATAMLAGGMVTTAHAEATTDTQIRSAVEQKLSRYVFYSIFDDVQGTIRNGVVTLTGHVTAPYKATEMANLVKQVSGVREVENKIETLPVSMFDDELRVGIARAIYRDPMFWNYAIQVNPPIHIIVNNGHVTLTGVVNSNVERMMAESIARSADGVFSVENNLRLENDVRGSN